MGALGALMAMQQKDKDKPPPPPPSGALQPNGSLNCQMADSYRYADCDSYLTQACMGYGAPTAMAQTLPNTGTIISTPGGLTTPDCNAFTARYCSPTVSGGSSYGNALPNGAVTQVNVAGSGEGIHTPFCQVAVANVWCNDPAMGPARAQCPSCRQAASLQGATCAANPALCLAQGTGNTGNNPACAGDPLYTAGSPYASPGTVAGGATPALFLPQSAGGTNPGGQQPGRTIVTSNAKASRSTAGGAAREGGSVPSFAPPNGSAAAIAKASRATSSDIVSTGGVIVARAPSASSGPAPDVQGQYGPSLFVTSTSVIRQRCQEGKLNNCP
jgi:hypothetical protein